MDDPIAQVIAECVDALQSRQASVDELLEKYAEYGAEIKPILDEIVNIRRTPVARPRPEFVSGARQRLVQKLQDRKPVAVAVTALPRGTRFDPGFGARYTRPALWISLIIAVVFVSLLGSGTVYASNQALPGDLLYPVKTQVEHLRLQFADEKSAVELDLEFSARRTQEIDQLANLGRFAQIPGAVNSLNSYLGDASKRIDKMPAEEQAELGPVQEKIDQSVKHNITVLNQVIEKVPDPAKDAINHAIEESQKNHPNLHRNGVPGALPTEGQTEPSLTTDNPTPDPNSPNSSATQGNSPQTPAHENKPDDHPGNSANHLTPQPDNKQTMPPGQFPKSTSPPSITPEAWGSETPTGQNQDGGDHQNNDNVNPPKSH